MSSEILVYIWIVGRAYLGTGLFIAILMSYIAYTSEESVGITWKEFLFTIILHPVVVYFFIKELKKWN
jgi:hypothetical protein